LRRISIADVRPGMMLAEDVLDWTGMLLVDNSKVLDDVRIIQLHDSDDSSIIIQEEFTEDVFILPAVPAEVEAEAAVMLRRLLENNRGVAAPDMALELSSVDRVIKAMLQNLANATTGDLNLDGCHSPANYEYRHGVRTTILCIQLGRNLGYPHGDLVKLGKAAFLRNIGYTWLPREITTGPPESLTPSELKSLHRHPALGHDILRSRASIEPEVLKAVAEHHEHWDGSGYPRGLKGKDISAFARIIAIADTFHARISLKSRQGREKPPAAAGFIRAQGAKAFDPKMVKTFTRSISFCPRGTPVRMNTGEYGIIIADNSGHICRPVVRLCYDRHGKELRGRYDIDLAKEAHRDLKIADMEVSLPYPDESETEEEDGNDAAQATAPELSFTPLFKPRPGSVPVVKEIKPDGKRVSPEIIPEPATPDATVRPVATATDYPTESSPQSPDVITPARALRFRRRIVPEPVTPAATDSSTTTETDHPTGSSTQSPDVITSARALRVRLRKVRRPARRIVRIVRSRRAN